MAEKILKLLPGSTTEEAAEVINALKTLVKLAPGIARTRMAFFKAHISEGFTPEQALELCKNVSVI